MRNILFIIIILFNFIPAKAYFFATDLETKITQLSTHNIELEITQHDDKNEDEVYPIGTKLYGSLFEYKERKRTMRDEILRIHIDHAILPDGTKETVNKDIKLRPRVLFSAKHAGAGVAAVTGLVLKITIAVWSVGFPVGRGAKAINDAAFGVYNTPEMESKWKQGAKGFTKGILFPLPELFLKGEELPIHKDSYLWIQDAKPHKKNLTAFIIKRKNLFLANDKYYKYTGDTAINFNHLLEENRVKEIQPLQVQTRIYQ